MVKKKQSCLLVFHKYFCLLLQLQAHHEYISVTALLPGFHISRDLFWTVLSGRERTYQCHHFHLIKIRFIFRFIIFYLWAKHVEYKLRTMLAGILDFINFYWKSINLPSYRWQQQRLKTALCSNIESTPSPSKNILFIWVMSNFLEFQY